MELTREDQAIEQRFANLARGYHCDDSADYWWMSEAPHFGSIHEPLIRQMLAFHGCGE